ncbi:hypothetical protein BCD48_43605 [Pseudofrankia sp. BMG5.36]|nr:hypothetical protein BCD48_43605 [Pseudofrankia sp. BMG5.36]
MSREELLGLVAAQAGLVEELRAGLAERDRRLAEQGRRIEELVAEVDRLKRASSRNSGNSSLPPSSDGVLPGRAAPNRAARRAASGGKKKRGKQQSEDGRTLAWSEDPDERVEHRPVGACGCGRDLADAALGWPAHIRSPI